MHTTPLAYFLTFSCYGARLHGHAEFSVDRENNAYGRPTLESNARRRYFEKGLMKESPYILNENERSVVLNRIIDTCSWRGWHLFAVHVRSNHVHVVVQADTSPERAIAAFKANATRGLKEIEDSSRQGKRWAHHGSTQYIWNRDGLDTAINYVIDEQGKAMATYISPRR